LKIDKVFVDNIHLNKEDFAITQTIIGLAEALGLMIIAEGIECEEQAELLRNENCHEAQGYYFSKPLPVSEFEAFLMRKRLKVKE